jgi:subtilisin-like proprotein convertase family protein
MRRLRHELLEDRRMLSVDPGWLVAGNGPGGDTAHDVAQDDVGNVYVAGAFDSGTDEITRGTTVALPETSSLSSPIVAVANLAGMDGGNGGWAVLYGDDSVAAEQLVLAVDEDQLYDAERSHTTEQAAYVVFEDSGPISSFLETGLVPGVADQWVTIPLANIYSSAVVVATPNYDFTHEPVVTRIANVTANSFDLRVQRTDGLSDAVTPVDVHFLVVEEGRYTQAVDGITMEAVKLDGPDAPSITDGSGSWLGAPQSYQNTYSTPVVVGQVMSANDGRFSTFWARGSEPTEPPSTTDLYVGKHVGEDPDAARLDETIGYLVLEQTEGQLEGIPFVAGLSQDIVVGVDDDASNTLATEIIAKYDSDGTLLWTVSVDGSAVEGLGAAIDTAGSLVVGGWFEGTVDFDPAAAHPGASDVLTSQGERDLFVLSIDSGTGNYQWVSQAGGMGTDFFEGIDVDSGGSVYIAGYLWSATADFGPHQVDNPVNMTGYVAKLDTLGSFIWANGIGDIPGGGTFDNGWAVAYDVAVDPTDDSVYVGGMFAENAEFESTDGMIMTRATTGDRDAYIAKYSSDGVVLRVDQFGAVANSTYDHLMRVYVRALAIDTLGNVYAAGQFGAMSTGSSYPIPGTIDLDPGPGTAERTVVGSWDGFAVKLDSGGGFVCGHAFGGLSSDEGADLAVDGFGQAYVVGQFAGQASFGGATLTSEGVEDSFISVLDADFNYVRTHRLGGEGYDHARVVAVAEPGMVLLAGDFQATASLPTGQLLGATGGSDLFISRFNTTSPILDIASPTRGSAASLVAEDSSLMLSGVVSDDDLGTNVEWYLMPDEVPLGVGDPLTVPAGTLPVGDHLIKGRVTDTDGLTAVASTTVTVASQVYDSSDTPMSVSKLKGKTPGKAESTISVSEPLSVFDVNVQASLDWGALNNSDTDLAIFLNSPGGTRIELVTATQANIPGVTFDDEAAISITSASAPYTGRLRPAVPLSTFDGEDALGPWTLEVENHSSNTATLLSWSLAITDTPPNDPPVAEDDTATTDEDTVVDIDVLANDTDADGDPLTVDSFTQGANGTVVDSGSGILTYTPDANFNGSDSFTYTINDGRGGTDTATVNVTISPVNDAPNAVDDSVSTPQDTPIVIAVLSNDTDVDLDTLSIESFGQGTIGTVFDNGDGSLTYTPAGTVGNDSFIYTISDGNGGTDTATVNVTVTRVNNAPVAQDDTYVTDEDTQLVVNAPGVLGNDSDADGDPLTAILVSGPSDGVLVLNADGSFTYTPNSNFNGSDSFSYKANDTIDDSNVAMVNVTITPVNDAPVATDDSATTDQEVAVTIDVLANDSDIDGHSLSVSVVDSTSEYGGAITDNVDGTVTYAPPLDWTGTDTFGYTASDGKGGTDTATVTILVQPAAATMHVGDLDGSSHSVNKRKWAATATILVQDGSASPVSNATVYGLWSNGLSVTATTNVAGLASVSSGNVDKSIDSVMFTVTDAQHATFSYDPNANTDPDLPADSNGMAIVIFQDGTTELPQSLLVDGSFDTAASDAMLTQHIAAAAATQAMALWSRQLGTAVRQEIHVSVADLPKGTLGWAYQDTLTLDTNADGAGWHLGLDLPSSGRFDLLTVVSHEIGHTLGFDHSLDHHDVMAANLNVGTRRLPGGAQLALTDRLVIAPLTWSRLGENDDNQDESEAANVQLVAIPSTSPTADQPQRILRAGEAKLLKDATDEATQLIDDELLDLLI